MFNSMYYHAIPSSMKLFEKFTREKFFSAPYIFTAFFTYISGNVNKYTIVHFSW